MSKKATQALKIESLWSDRVRLYLNVLLRFFAPSMPITTILILFNQDHEQTFINILTVLYPALGPVAFLLYETHPLEWWNAILFSCYISLIILTFLAFSKLSKEVKLKLSLRLGIINSLFLILLFKLNL